jgi:predicted PurR-regulated permease PerM
VGGVVGAFLAVPALAIANVVRIESGEGSAGRSEAGGDR